MQSLLTKQSHNTQRRSNQPRQFSTNLMSEITSNAVLDAALAEISKRREEDKDSSDIWELRRHWQAHKHIIREQLLAGIYYLSPVDHFGYKNGHALTRWSEQDAVVLKAMSTVLTPIITDRIDTRCHHVKGNGGLKGAVNSIRAHLQDSENQFKFVVKSDIADFYASTSHEVLLEQCAKIFKDTRVLDVLQQYMNRVEVREGEHDLISIGIAKGCPLSPLMGALMLKSLDKMIPTDCAYARYMDDWVILIPTRRRLRQVVKNMHGIVHRLKYKLAFNKTFIGRIERGFDFLGYRLGANGQIGLAKQTILNHWNKLSRLYEQSASDQCVREYKTNWLRWVGAGLTLC